MASAQAADDTSGTRVAVSRGVRAWWLLGLLSGCNEPATCDGVTDDCGGAVAVGDGKSDATGLPFHHMTDHGGTVMASLKLWTIAWPVDHQLASDLDAFHAWMLASPYWANILGQYGVGAGQAMGAVIVDGDPPARFDGTDLPEQVLGALFASGALPPADDQSAYLFVVPQATATPPGTGAYHDVLPNLKVPYEVTTQDTFDQMTYGLSHETAELATDPRLDAYYSDRVWFGEVGDLCNDLSRRVAGYEVSRLFSNHRAARGLDPCVPVRTAEYRGVVVTPIAPVLALDGGGNATATMTLRAFSSNPNVTAVLWTSSFVNPDAHVGIAPDHGVATIGAPVTIRVTAQGASGVDLPLALRFDTVIPDPTSSEWNAGDVSEWNTELRLQ
jgi:hypothetical protein